MQLLSQLPQQSQQVQPAQDELDTSSWEPIYHQEWHQQLQGIVPQRTLKRLLQVEQNFLKGLLWKRRTGTNATAYASGATFAVGKLWGVQWSGGQQMAGSSTSANGVYMHDGGDLQGFWMVQHRVQPKCMSQEPKLAIQLWIPFLKLFPSVTCKYRMPAWNRQILWLNQHHPGMIKQCTLEIVPIGSVRRRVTGKDGPSSYWRPAAMRQDDFVEIMKEIVSPLVEQAMESSESDMSRKRALKRLAWCRSGRTSACATSHFWGAECRGMPRPCPSHAAADYTPSGKCPRSFLTATIPLNCKGWSRMVSVPSERQLCLKAECSPHPLRSEGSPDQPWSSR